jgi:hypothetical protein
VLAKLEAFLAPAEVVRPHRARGGSLGRQGKGERDGEREGDGEEEREGKGYREGAGCYTHTASLAGRCWVLCGHRLLVPCRT